MRAGAAVCESRVETRDRERVRRRQMLSVLNSHPTHATRLRHVSLVTRALGEGERAIDSLLYRTRGFFGEDGVRRARLSRGQS
jgi:hypothetical protein